MVQAVRPRLNIFALVDFDPDGIAIMLVYKNGSRQLDHERGITVPRLRWLGICSRDLIQNLNTCPEKDPVTSEQLDASLSSSQQVPRTGIDLGGKTPQDHGRNLSMGLTRTIHNGKGPIDSLNPLTARDRKKAVKMLQQLCEEETPEGDYLEHVRELQRMLMLNFKAEIQAVDNLGDLTSWLDETLCTRNN